MSSNVGNFVHIGHGNYVMITRVIAIADARQPSIAQRIDTAQKNGALFDCTNGKGARSVLFSDQSQLILSALQARTVISRLEHQMLLREAVLHS